MNGDLRLYLLFDKLQIKFKYIEHPPAPTIEIAMKYWKNHEAQHCKNIFFRNHKGDKHYLVILNCNQILNIRSLELLLKQGKLTFASDERLCKYLGLKPGSVSPFGLINDKDKHVSLFIDETLKNADYISFHPNENTASLIISFSDFEKFLNYCGNQVNYIQLY